MPKTLLLADDSVVIQKLVGLSFANEDVRLVTTDNGDDALTRARNLKPDLVLADVVMPGMSGYDVCAAIKADPELSSTPVLLLTGTFEAFDEERARRAGSDGHITKPFEAQALVERVNRLLAENRSGRVAAKPPADDAFDFFDEGSAELGAPEESELEPQTTRVLATTELDDGFSFGAGDVDLSQLNEAELLGEPLDLDGELGNRGSDRTVALVPGLEQGSQESPTVTSLAVDDFDPLAAVADSLGEPVAEPVLPEAARRPGSDSSVGAWPVAYSTQRRAPAPPPLPVQDSRVEDSFGSQITSPSPAAPTTMVLDSADDGLAFGSDDSQPGPDLDLAGAPGASARTPDPTPLSDDLFASDPLLGARDLPSKAPAPTADRERSASAARARGFESPPEAAAGYDVSSSDLGDPFARPISRAELDDDLLGPPPVLGGWNDEEVRSPASSDDMGTETEGLSLSEDLLGSSQPELGGAFGAASPPAPAQAADPARSGSASPDLTPLMRERIHETLERVAWEAFADLSDTLVKQVLERVEAIAWEVIPQMAETLIRDEIRRMKGEDGE